MYVYLRNSQGNGDYLYTVGFYDPSGQWHPDSDHETSEEAGKRVHYLNGGREEPIEIRPTKKIKPTSVNDYYCCVCRDVPVDAENGVDTCKECVDKI